METPIIITNESTGFNFVCPEDNASYIRRSIMMDNYVELVFNRGENLIIPAFSQITFYGDTYWLLQDYSPRIISDVWHYRMRFVALQDLFFGPLFFRHFANTKEADFFLNANLKTCGEILIESLQKSFPEWTFELGQYAGDTELKALNFSGISIGEALNYVAGEFETEWWLQKKDDVAISSPEAGSTVILNLSKCQRLGSLSLYTDHNETSHNVQPFNLVLPDERPERLFVFGGDKNMPPNVGLDQSFRNRLRLPNGQEFIHIEGGRPGLEAIEFFDDIFPNTKMQVSEVRTFQLSTDETIWSFKARNLDGSPFEMPEIMSGETLQAFFQSGNLNGRDFDIRINREWFDVVPRDENNMVLPNQSLRPRVDDDFVFLNVEMKPEFITNAQHELLQEATKFADNILRGTPQINLQSNSVFFAKNNPQIVVGRNVRLHDYQLAGGKLDSRIIEYSHPLYQPENVSFTISEATSSGRLRNIESQIRESNNFLHDTHATARTISRHAWRNSVELSEMYESLKAELILVGNEDDQFTTTSGFQANFQNNRNVIRATAGQLQHVVFPRPNGGGVWQMSEFISPPIDASKDNVPFFIYARCSRTGTSGVYTLSETRLPSAENNTYPNDFCFLIGALSSVFENKRVVQPTHGFTMIAGGSITTERIQNAGGDLIVDLSSDPPRIIARNGAKIQGNIEFSSGSDFVSMEEFSTQTNQNINRIDDTLAGIRPNHIHDYDPDVNNLPASQWIADGVEENHVREIFTNFLTGRSWIWLRNNNNIFGWAIITDSDAVTALANAATAMETANGASVTAQQAIGIVNNIQIGGENLVNNSQAFHIANSDYPTISIRSTRGEIQIIENGLGNAHQWFQPPTPIAQIGRQIGRPITFSIDIRFEGPPFAMMQFLASIRGPGHINMIERGVQIEHSLNWKRYSVTIDIPNNYPISPNQIAYLAAFLFSGALGTTIFYRNVKIEFGNIATDWSPSKEDIDTGVAAAANIGIGAVNRLNNLGSPDIISKDEKADLQLEMTEFINLANGLITIAENIRTGLGNDLTNRRNSLHSFYWSDMNIGDLNVDTAFPLTSRNTFVRLWDEFNRSVSQLQTNISQAQVDSIEIGGRNFLLNSRDYWFNGSDFPAITTRTQNLIRVIQNGIGNAYRTWMPISNQLPILGRFLTCSIEVSFFGDFHGTTEFWFNVRGGGINGFLGSSIQIPYSTQWRRYSITIFVPNNTSWVENQIRNFMLCGFTFNNAINLGIEYRNMKVEVGNKSTDWIPAPEDMDYLHEATSRGRTVINGGLLLSNVLATTPIGNQTEQQIRSVMSGIDGDNVAFAAHTSNAYNDAVAFAQSNPDVTRRPNFLVTKQGILFARGANIMGNISVSEGGHIGNFSVEQNELVGRLGNNVTRIKSSTVGTRAQMLAPTSQIPLGVPASNSGTINSWWYHGDFGAGGWLTDESNTSGVFSVSNGATFFLSGASLVSVNWNHEEINRWSLPGSNWPIVNSNLVFVRTDGVRFPANWVGATNLPGGTYRMIIEWQAWASGGYGFEWSAGIDHRINFISAQVGENRQDTILAPDGILSFLNQNSYLFFSKDEGFEVRFGNNMMRVSNLGMQKSTNGGTTWLPL